MLYNLKHCLCSLAFKGWHDLRNFDVKKHFYKEVIKKDSKVLQMVSEVLFNTWWV